MNMSLSKSSPTFGFEPNVSASELVTLTHLTDDTEADWPSLERLIMPPDQVSARIEGVGGSDANTILSGDIERILRLWREKRGAAEPEDLSMRLPVMLGCWTEAFNRQWYEQETGLYVSRV